MDNSADNRRITAITIDPYTQQVLEEYREGDRWTKREAGAAVLPPSDIPTTSFGKKPYSKRFDSAYAVMLQDPPPLSALKVLWALMPTVRYRSCECRHANGKRITMKWVGDATKLHRNSVSRAIKWLEEHGYLLRKDGAILINPYFSQRGAVSATSAVDLFRDTQFAKGATE